MVTLWYGLVAFMLAMYVVFDGFDLGAGAIHLFVARDRAERRSVLRSIGPVWDGNEVWLLAAGGTLFFAFPTLYAVSFSGFYLPLMIVLWLLILRGISIEFRNKLDNAVWAPFWDAVFAGASALLAVFFGAALGNVVRGVPLDDDGWFFAPLWTDFRVGPEPGILDWYSVLVGLAALAALAHHGALWVTLKTLPPVETRARAAARALWWSVAALTVAITVVSLAIQPLILRNLREYPWGALLPALALAGLFASRAFAARRRNASAFLGSCTYLAGMLASVAFGVYPYVLPAAGEATAGLTAFDAATSPYALRVGLAWFIPGLALIASYFVYTYRHFAGKVAPEGETLD